MTSLAIKDLEMTKALSREELAAVHGGFVMANAGQFGSGFNQAGGGIFSPTIGIQVNPQIITQVPLNLDIAAIIASAGTVVAQA
jgi:hypothetical protein